MLFSPLRYRIIILLSSIGWFPYLFKGILKLFKKQNLFILFPEK